MDTQNPTNHLPTEDKMTRLIWQAPSRIFKKRDRVFFQTVIALVILIGMILFLLKEFLLIGVVLSVAFVAYVLATVPPQNIDYRITVSGFDMAGIHHRWEEFSEFWFEVKPEATLLVLKRKIPGFPGHVMAILGNQDKQKLKEVLNDYLPFREVPEKNWLDSFAHWLGKRFPFEKSSKTS